MEDLTGKQFGPYQIVAPLGEGGMAAVYKAYQPAMERYVALKVLPRHFAEDAQFVARFQREAKLVAQLQHPHILPVFDYGKADGYAYIVMPFIQSGILTDSLKGDPLPLSRIRQVISQIGDALNYAHAHGLIHRDVKPSNVLIDEGGNCLLTDFGLARIVESSVNLTTSGAIMGTPAYMSPEQGSGQKVDARSDIYSLGIILYEMATGRVPFRAETPIAVVFKHIQDPLPPARSLNPELPEAVELVILKALSKNLEDRYLTAGDMVRAIQAAIPDISVALKPISSAEKATPRYVEKPEISLSKQTKMVSPIWLWSILGIAAIIIVGGLGIIFGPDVNSVVQNFTSTIGATTSVVSPNSLQPTPTIGATALPTAGGGVTGEVDCARDDVFCVGLVTDVGKVNDKSFNQSAWEGVQQAKADGVADVVQFIETSDAKDYAKNISTFADAKYDVIVTVGFGLGEATFAAGQAYPDVKFIGVDQFQAWEYTEDKADDSANVTGLNFPEDNAGFLVGALAAMMSQSHVIGAVCGTDVVPPVWRFGEGYKAGAAYADGLKGTTTEVQVVYHSDVGFDKTFTDPEWGAQTAKAMMDNGADAIFGCGGITGNGAITAAAQAGKYAIGVDADQYLTLPEAALRMLSSAMKLITPGVAELIAAAKGGTIEGGNFIGEAGYAPFHDLDSKVPADVKSEMEKINAGLFDGSITTGVSPAKP